MSNLKEFRKRKDEFFANDQQSPLTREQKRVFKGLKYFPGAPELDLVVEVERIEEDDEVHMQTSTGDVQSYRRYGKFRFPLDGGKAELTIFSDGNGFFLPFVDSLAGEQTYPAGRYLEPEPLANGKFKIDFNMAYNPYCAYNDMWSCPLTPAENRLKVPIRAGEMIFHEEN
jgi:uncharacterized protein (DUF1684 family)